MDLVNGLWTTFADVFFYHWVFEAHPIAWSPHGGLLPVAGTLSERSVLPSSS